MKKTVFAVIAAALFFLMLFPTASIGSELFNQEFVDYYEHPLDWDTIIAHNYNQSVGKEPPENVTVYSSGEIEAWAVLLPMPYVIGKEYDWLNQKGQVKIIEYHEPKDADVKYILKYQGREFFQTSPLFKYALNDEDSVSFYFEVSISTTESSLTINGTVDYQVYHPEKLRVQIKNDTKDNFPLKRILVKGVKLLTPNEYGWAYDDSDLLEKGVVVTDEEIENAENYPMYPYAGFSIGEVSFNNWFVYIVKQIFEPYEFYTYQLVSKFSENTDYPLEWLSRSPEQQKFSLHSDEYQFTLHGLVTSYTPTPIFIDLNLKPVENINSSLTIIEPLHSTLSISFDKEHYELGEDIEAVIHLSVGAEGNEANVDKTIQVVYPTAIHDRPSWMVINLTTDANGDVSINYGATAYDSIVIAEFDYEGVDVQSAHASERPSTGTTLFGDFIILVWIVIGFCCVWLCFYGFKLIFGERRRGGGR